MTMEKKSSESTSSILTMDTSQRTSTRLSATSSSFLACKRNIVDIMEQGQQLRCELQSIRHEFLGLLNANDALHPSHDALALKQKSCDTKPNTQILHLLKSASEKLQRSQVAPTSPQFGSKAFATVEGCQNPTDAKRKGLNVNDCNSPNVNSVQVAKKFFDSPDIEKATLAKNTDDLKIAVTKRKQFFSSPVLSKMPRLDSCLSCDNLLSEDKENIGTGVSTPKSRKSSRRSSLQKLLSPMRRRSGSWEKQKSCAPKPAPKSRLSIITNGLLFSRNQVDAVDDVPKKSAHLPRIKTVFAPRDHGVRLPADGSESADSARSSTVYSVNDTVKTVELSSDVYSTTPCSTFNRVPTPPKQTNHSLSLHEHSAVTDIIRRVTCNFVTPIDESQKCQPEHVPKSKLSTAAQSQAVNRINASELMTSIDDESTVISDGEPYSGQRKATPSAASENIANISTISLPNTTDMTLREQASVCDLTAANVLHSTFNYPLHSTMYNPLQCTIANIQKSMDGEGLELSGDDLELSVNNSTSDCDSSVLSLDVDTTALDVNATETNGNCNVCKVTQLRREMAQPRLESRRRRAPVGLSQTDIDLESKLPKERPAPIGASQSILDADKTLIGARESQDETLSATIGSVPNFTALTELDSTLKAGSAAAYHKLFNKGGNSKRNISKSAENNSAVKKSKAHRKSSRKSIHDKENQYHPNADCAKSNKRYQSGKMRENKEDYISEFSITPSSSSYLSTSQKRELKRKFRSFNSTINSSHQTTLAFF